MQGKDAGFTLLEALVALAVTSILAAVVVPAYTAAVAATHAGSVRTLLYDSVVAAGNHAVLDNAEVVLCASDNGDGCSGSADWTGGWIVFADIDGNRNYTTMEALLRRQAALPGGIRLRSTSGRTRLLFQPRGGMPGSNVTFTMCDKRGVAKATSVVLGNSGRIRQGVSSAVAAAACVYGG